MNSIDERYNRLVAKLNRKLIYNKPNGKKRNEMLSRQGHACAICGEKFKNNKKTNIDHCHLIQKPRGILCVRCNVGLGQFQDNIVFLERAIKYLTKWNEKYKAEYDKTPREMTLEEFEGIVPEED